jgi:hypothetical protein
MRLPGCLRRLSPAQRRADADRMLTFTAGLAREVDDPMPPAPAYEAALTRAMDRHCVQADGGNVDCCPEHGDVHDHVEWGPLVLGLADTWLSITYFCGCTLLPDGTRTPAEN